MALQFDPSPYLAAFQYGQNNRNANNQDIQKGLESLGQGVGQYKQLQRQKAMDELQKRQDVLKTGIEAKNAGVDPGAATNYMATGQFPSAPSQPMDSSSPSAPPMQSPPSPMFGQMPSGGSPYSQSDPSSGPNIPSQAPAASPVIDAWNNHPDRTQFAPQASQGQAAKPTTGFGSLFQSQNVDVGDVINKMAKGDYSGWQNLPPAMQSKVEADPRYKQLAKQPKPEDLRTPEQVGALYPHLDTNALAKAYPKGIPKEDLASIGQGQHFNLQTSEKQDQMDRKRWDTIIKDTDPYKASSRSPLGMATIGNLKADHVIPILKNPNATNQDINASLAAIDTVFQGGAATQSGIHSQEYDTIQSRLANIKTLLTSNPSAVATPEVKQHLLDLLTTLKQVNSGLIKDQLDYVETAQPELIQKNSAAWQGLRKIIGVDQSSPAGQGGGQNSGGLMWQGRPLKDTPANRAWLAAQGGAK